MIRWYVQRDDLGEPIVVARIREEVDATTPEIWNGRIWRYWPPVMSFLMDPLAADSVDEVEAATAIRELAAQ